MLDDDADGALDCVDVKDEERRRVDRDHRSDGWKNARWKLNISQRD